MGCCDILPKPETDRASRHACPPTAGNCITGLDPCSFNLTPGSPRCQAHYPIGSENRISDACLSTALISTPIKSLAGRRHVMDKYPGSSDSSHLVTPYNLLAVPHAIASAYYQDPRIRYLPLPPGMVQAVLGNVQYLPTSGSMCEDLQS